ncbi:MAG: hypothetical protein IJH43_00690 [Mogibacterium sp.]|nr:hypothetical protein [Mogibacterium sp.]
MMKRKTFIYLLTLVLMLSPAAAFADTVPADGETPDENPQAELLIDEQEAVQEPEDQLLVNEDDEDAVSAPVLTAAGSESRIYTDWGENRDFIYDSQGNVVTGLFKAPTIADADFISLYYAHSPSGRVEKTVGICSVPAGEDKFIYDTDKKGWTGADAKLTDVEVKYYIPSRPDGDFYFEHEPGIVSGYYLQPDGTIRTEKGVFTDNKNVKYYSEEGGAIRTAEGFVYDKDGSKYYIPANAGGKILTKDANITYQNKKWHVGADGKIRTTAGVFKSGSYYYCASSDGSLVTKVGFTKVGNKTYYIQNANGVVRTAVGPFNVGSNKYIVQSGGVIRTTTGLVKVSGKWYHVKNSSGALTINKKFKIGKKLYHAGTNAVVITGVHKWSGYYYYSDAKGVVKVKAGIVKYNGKYYYVKKGGKIVTNKKFKAKKKSYISNKKGVIYTGFFTWKKGLYYSTSKGVLRTKKGFFKNSGNRYYVGGGAKIYKNKSFKVGGKTYRAYTDGSILTGYYLWKNKYYYANEKGALRTAKGIFYDPATKKYYYNKSGGGLMTDSFVEDHGKYYYVGSGGAVKTSKFTYTYKGTKYTIVPKSKTGEISKEDYVRIFGDVDDEDEEEDANA